MTLSKLHLDSDGTMKTFHRILSTEDKWYDKFYAVYSVSFPVFEQRNREQQRYAFTFENYYLDCLTEGDRFLAFIAYWDFNEYIYIEHFAVNPDYRGENIGSRTLRQLIARKKKMILLEIDPLHTDIARKRYCFYERLGFVANEYIHHHPPYKKEFPAHELIILSLGQTIAPSLYDTFYMDLSEIVMDYKRE